MSDRLFTSDAERGKYVHRLSKDPEEALCCPGFRLIELADPAELCEQWRHAQQPNNMVRCEDAHRHPTLTCRDPSRRTTVHPVNAAHLHGDELCYPTAISRLATEKEAREKRVARRRAQAARDEHGHQETSENAYRAALNTFVARHDRAPEGPLHLVERLAGLEIEEGLPEADDDIPI